MAISVAVPVGQETADALVAKLTERVKGLKVGHSLDKESDFGPVVARSAKDRIEGYIQSGVDEGATLVADGRGLTVDGYDGGFWVGPTVIDHVKTEMTAYTEEIFGPVLVVVRVDTLEDGINLINANPYGNGTSIFTTDGRAARRFQHEVSVGMVGINVPIPVPMAFYSFGGWKASLFGDKHIYGPEGVSFYTRGKVVTSRWPEPTHASGASYNFPSN
ncbi:MAG: hypothetical protein NVS2B15_26230 [Pseudarthrobacter sp.]